MPEFAMFQQNAKQLPMKIARSYNGYNGCYSFFACVPQLINNSAMEDSVSIGLMAECLCDDNDRDLKYHLQETQNKEYTPEEFETFKCRILAGMYLVIWCKYTSTVSSYLNSKLIELLQMELNIREPSQMDPQEFNSSLDALSQYCSYVFLKRYEGIFSRLHQRLGESIQADIFEVRNSKGIIDHSWSGVVNGIMNSLGMNNVF